MSLRFVGLHKTEPRQHFDTPALRLEDYILLWGQQQTMTSCYWYLKSCH